MEIVIFTQRVEVVESYGERRDCADQRIAEFIRMCGYLAIPVPNNVECLGDIAETLNPAGILLTGGNSLVKYGGNAPERDLTDAELIKLAERKGIPLYGFCRGMQSILDYYGNKLINVSNHVSIRHRVNGSIGTHEVNSYHNQGCMELATGCNLEVLAQADDGVIEAVRHKEYPIYATMWHPEREREFVVSDISRVKKLFHLGGV